MALSVDEVSARYPIHWLVWNDQHEELQKALDAKKFMMEDLESKDPRGRTPLLLAVTLGHIETVRVLLDAGADVNCEKDGWTAVQEATATGDIDLLSLVLSRRNHQRYLCRSRGIPDLLNRLSLAPDFYVEMKWQFTSWMPLISRVCPSDTYKVYKRGANVRVDTTLIGFENRNWLRGDISYIFKGQGTKAKFMELNHEAGTVSIEQIDGTDLWPNPVPRMKALRRRLEEPLAINYLDTDKISFERNKSGIWGWRQDKSEIVNGYDCKVFSANNVEIVSKTRCEHLPAGAKRTPRSQPIAGLLGLDEPKDDLALLQADEELQNCPDVCGKPKRATVSAESDPETESRPGSKGHIEPGRKKPTDLGHKGASGSKKDAPDSDSTGTGSGAKRGSKRPTNLMPTKSDLNAAPKPKHHDILQAAFETMPTVESRHPPIIQQLGGCSIGPKIPMTLWTYRRAKSFKNKPVKNTDGTDDSSTDEDEIGMCISERRVNDDEPETLPEIQPLPEIIPEIQQAEESSGSEEGEGVSAGQAAPVTWQDYFSGEPMSADIGRPKDMTTKVQKFKATLSLCEDYPLELQEQIMPILDLMTAIASPHFAKLKDFIQMQLPSGFPVKIEIPLFHVMNARITFGNIFGTETPVPLVESIQEGDRLSCIIDDQCFNIGRYLANLVRKYLGSQMKLDSSFYVIIAASSIDAKSNCECLQTTETQGYKDAGSDDRLESEDGEEGLLQYAIQQSLMEAGTHEDQVDVWEALRGEKPSPPPAPLTHGAPQDHLAHEERQLQRAIEASLASLSLNSEAPSIPAVGVPAVGVVCQRDVDADLAAALALSAEEQSAYDERMAEEQKALDEALRISLLEK